MNLEVSGHNKQADATFDNGYVKIYLYKGAVVVEKYKETEITGEQQQQICTFIAENYGLSRIGIVLKSAKYGMSMQAMMILKEFMANYRGPFGFADPSVEENKAVISNYSNATYLKNKVTGTYSTLQIAYDELVKLV